MCSEKWESCLAPPVFSNVDLTEETEDMLATEIIILDESINLKAKFHLVHIIGLIRRPVIKGNWKIRFLAIFHLEGFPYESKLIWFNDGP